MYKIGELSQLCRLPVKTLRYWADIGLLVPDEVDRFTGYRYYNASRLADCCRIVALKELGFTLEEIPDWQCCGGVYPLGTDEIATKLSSVRALADAKANGRELVTLCSACHHVIKRVNDDMKHVSDIRTRANNYLKLDEPYAGETNVLHFLEVLRDRVGFDELKKKVTNPLTGRKIGAYYGCLLLRPGKIMAFDDPENPVILEDFIRAIGAEPVIYPYRNECCGGYLSVQEPEKAARLSGSIGKSAAGFEAEMLITACPRCMYNLKKSQSELPVVYCTELLAGALGVKEDGENA
jgi:heterodisulfide reductase subunit B